MLFMFILAATRGCFYILASFCMPVGYPTSTIVFHKFTIWFRTVYTYTSIFVIDSMHSAVAHGTVTVSDD